MTTNPAGPQRLYLMQVATVPPVNFPAVCYLVQTGDGKNILIDSGLPATLPPMPPGRPTPVMGKNVLEQLAEISVRPEDISTLICTHFDPDHAGNHASFPNAELIVQREHYTFARGGAPRFAIARSQWDQPEERYRLIDGDTELLPGLTLLETSGHTAGHQSVLLHLPETGAVLLTIDAVPNQQSFIRERTKSPMDEDEERLRASTNKLIDIAQREHALVIFGHDGQQWPTLKKLPEYYS